MRAQLVRNISLFLTGLTILLIYLGVLSTVMNALGINFQGVLQWQFFTQVIESWG